MKVLVLGGTRFFGIHLVDELLLGNDVRLPKSMGTIEVRKFDRGAKIGKDGKIHINLPIDQHTDQQRDYSKHCSQADTEKIFFLHVFSACHRQCQKKLHPVI